jgi:putative salt-induced outer membrane protein YdiY
MLLILAATLIAVPTDTVSLKADAGFVNTSGNTELTTLNLGTVLEIADAEWGVRQSFGVIYGTTEGETSTSLWRAVLRGGRSISSRVEFYLLSEFDRNTFAGIKSRFAQSTGLSAKLISAPRDQLSAELGVGYVWQKAVDLAPDQNFATGRAALSWHHALGDRSEFSQVVELLPNLEAGNDLRINAETALTAPLGAGIAMKASYIIRHDGKPEPGFKTTDRILTTGIQVTF